MDPDATLNEMRDLLARFLHNPKTMPTDKYERLAELTAAMDEWLSKGGFLPLGWVSLIDAELPSESKDT